MGIFRQLLNLLAIMAPAAVVIILLPEWLGVRLEFALIAGALIFLGGTVVMEAGSRAEGDKRLREEFHVLLAKQAAVRDELGGARREMLALHEALAAAATQRGSKGDSRDLSDVMDEVTVLKSLVSRLSEGQAQAQRQAGSRTGAVAAPALAAAGGMAVGGGGDLPLSLTPPLSPQVAETLDDQSVLGEVRRCLRQDSLDLMLQPAVSLPQRKRRFYECFTRIRTDDGAVLGPERYIELAEDAGLIAAIDNMLLFRCVQLVRKIQRENKDVGFFCNISLNTLEDTDFFGDFVDFLEGNAGLAKNLVFEFAYEDFRHHQKATREQLGRLLDLGCRLSVDQVDDLDIDPALLFERDIRFVKLEAAVLLAEGGGAAFASLKRELDSRAIDVIVEKIESEQDLIELLELGIDFGQGYLFGEPRLAKPAD